MKILFSFLFVVFLFACNNPEINQESEPETAAEPAREQAEETIANPGSAFEYRVYNDLGLGFTFSFPKSWQIDQSNSVLALIAAEPFQDSTDMFSESLSMGVIEHKGQTLAEIAKDNLHRAQTTYPDAQIGIAEVTTQQGIEGRVIEMTQNVNNLTLISYSIFFWHKTHVITATVTMESKHFERYKPVRNKLIESFAWLPEEEVARLRAKS